MDLSEISKKLGVSDSKHLIGKAAELRRLCDVQFDSSLVGVGEICKAVICLEIAASELGVLLERSSAIKVSGMSEKAYTRSYNSLQNGLGVKNKLDVRELAIQFGCVRIIPFVQKGLSLFKDRFLASLPASRRATADFTRPVFTAVAFYLSAKKHKLKVDKLRLIELCGASESEFSSVSTSMKELCFDTYGISKEKKDARDIKGNRELLDALPEKRKVEDSGYLSDEGHEVLKGSCYRRLKKIEKDAYEDRPNSMVESISMEKAARKPTRQRSLDFMREAPESQKLEAIKANEPDQTAADTTEGDDLSNSDVDLWNMENSSRRF